MKRLPLGLQSWERTIRAVEFVKARLLRATAALENAGIAYAVIGGIDRTHLRDLISVGLVDESWRVKLPDKLAERSQSLLDTPDG
jgi:hypothetical protein